MEDTRHAGLAPDKVWILSSFGSAGYLARAADLNRITSFEPGEPRICDAEWIASCAPF